MAKAAEHEHGFGAARAGDPTARDQAIAQSVGENCSAGGVDPLVHHELHPITHSEDSGYAKPA